MQEFCETLKKSGQLHNDIQAEAEQKVLDRLAKNKAYRDREDRLSKNWLYVIFLLPGPAQYIDTITDDIKCEGLLRDLGWSQDRIDKLMQNRYTLGENNAGSSKRRLQDPRSR